CQHYNNYPYSF
nr:immunoglobulin light chain junction region [Macaca mulatta]MOX88419.1 immunoglobulin light chain junction region [Macaca mulatta]MOX89438.1 immunoglobulin light chain junction region [Macaca mulatta]MOX91011.1 immunoglobulin light chain junction region [Macaca mulatta]